jgi:hypothetical protein
MNGQTCGVTGQHTKPSETAPACRVGKEHCTRTVSAAVHVGAAVEVDAVLDALHPVQASINRRDALELRARLVGCVPAVGAAEHLPGSTRAGAQWHARLHMPLRLLRGGLLGGAAATQHWQPRQLPHDSITNGLASLTTALRQCSVHRVAHNQTSRNPPGPRSPGGRCGQPSS